VIDVAEKHDRELTSLPENERLHRLCELNVVEQVTNVCQTTIVEDAWARGQDLTVHGVVYGLEDGLLRDLEMSIDSADAGRRHE
jgi:carbonic anhydrase